MSKNSKNPVSRPVFRSKYRVSRQSKNQVYQLNLKTGFFVEKPGLTRFFGIKSSFSIEKTTFLELKPGFFAEKPGFSTIKLKNRVSRAKNPVSLSKSWGFSAKNRVF